MILNEQQAAVARREVSEIGELVAAVSDELQLPLESRLFELREELDRYAELTSGSVRCFSIQSLADISLILTEARIARGWTQNILASRVGVSEQMVQKDEAGGYGRASLARLMTVANALDLEFTGSAHFADPQLREPAAEHFDEAMAPLNLDLMTETVGHLTFLAGAAGKSIEGYLEKLIDGEIELHMQEFGNEILAQVKALRVGAESLEKQVESLAVLPSQGRPSSQHSSVSSIPENHD